MEIALLYNAKELAISFTQDFPSSYGRGNMLYRDMNRGKITVNSTAENLMDDPPGDGLDKPTDTGGDHGIGHFGTM